MLAAGGLARSITDPTLNLVGTLDIVATRVDFVTPRVDAIDVGLSDHSSGESPVENAVESNSSDTNTH